MILYGISSILHKLRQYGIFLRKSYLCCVVYTFTYLNQGTYFSRDSKQFPTINNETIHNVISSILPPSTEAESPVEFKHLLLLMFLLRRLIHQVIRTFRHLNTFSPILHGLNQFVKLTFLLCGVIDVV